MSKPRKSPPTRMRTYRVEAEPRATPDLHKLAQLFIGMAFAAPTPSANQQAPPPSPRHEAGDKGKS